MNKKEPSEYIKAGIGLLQAVVLGVMAWLFSTVNGMEKNIIVHDTEIQHIKSELPKVSENLAKLTDAVNGLRSSNEGMKATIESIKEIIKGMKR